MQRFGTDDGTFFLKRLSNVPFTSLKWSFLLLNTVVNSMIPLEQKIARLQAPSPAAMLPNPRIASDLRMLDLLLRSFIRTGIAFFLTSSCVCSDLPAAILFKQPRAKHYKNVASYNHPNPSYMQSKRILQSLPYLHWTMFIGRQPDHTRRGINRSCNTVSIVSKLPIAKLWETIFIVSSFASPRKALTMSLNWEEISEIK
jgi:hypothetical protein